MLTTPEKIGFKSTDQQQPTTDHLLTNSLTHRPNYYQPYRHGNPTETTTLRTRQPYQHGLLVKCKTILRSIIYLMNNYLIFIL